MNLKYSEKRKIIKILVPRRFQHSTNELYELKENLDRSLLRSKSNEDKKAC